MNEPLEYLNRKELQLNILRNIERKIMQDNREFEDEPINNAEIKYWFENTVNWGKVQTFLNGNTKKAGSTSSTER